MCNLSGGNKRNEKKRNTIRKWAKSCFPLVVFILCGQHASGSCLLAWYWNYAHVKCDIWWWTMTNDYYFISCWLVLWMTRLQWLALETQVSHNQFMWFARYYSENSNSIVIRCILPLLFCWQKQLGNGTRFWIVEIQRVLFHAIFGIKWIESVTKLDNRHLIVRVLKPS